MANNGLQDDTAMPHAITDGKSREKKIMATDTRVTLATRVTDTRVMATGTRVMAEDTRVTENT